MRPEELLLLLDGVQGNSPQWSAKCPAHDDTNASLSIGIGKKGRVLLKCHRDCEFDEICAALDVRPEDLGPQKKLSSASGPYGYCDESGRRLFEVVRMPGKAFRQRRPDGKGKWIWNLQGVRRVLYRLPELIASIANKERIWVVEGEKDSDSLAALGLAATTNPGGAGKWREEFTEALARATEIVVIADRDHTGRTHAEKVRTSLAARGVPVCVVEVGQDRGAAKDATDWIELGATREDFERLAARSPAAPTPPPISVGLNPAVKPNVPKYDLTDLGNVERLVTAHANELRHCTALGWLVWNATRWEPSTNAAFQRVIDSVNAIQQEAAGATDSSVRNEILAHAKKSASKPRLDSVLTLAARDPRLAAKADDFDRAEFLVGVENGVATLDSGDFFLPNPTDMLTKQLSITYDDAATCPTWDEFIDRVFGGDGELIRYVQRAVGYSLTASTREQVFFIAQGIGANGKSTFTSTLQKLFGEYAAEAPPSLLLARQSDRHPTELAALLGKRFVVSHEFANGARLSESLVKQLTGGDRIKARFMRQDFFEFEPTFKLWVCTNYLPRFDVKDQALWRRIHVVPFSVVIPPEERDVRLPEVLRGELPGILRWVVEGAADWAVHGLQPPLAVTNAIAAYRRELDTVYQFVSEACALEPETRTRATPLFEGYKRWCADSGRASVSQKDFGQSLGSIAGLSSKKSHGNKVWLGIRLVEGEGRADNEGDGDDGEEASPFSRKFKSPKQEKGYVPPHRPRTSHRAPTRAKP